MGHRLIATLAAASALLLGAPTTALAADEPGILVIDPPSGDVSTSMNLMTAGFCERGVGFVVAVQGDGIDPQEAGNLVGMTEFDTLLPNDLGIHAITARSLGDYFVSSAGALPQKGDYTFVFACRNRLDTEWLQTFEATVRIAGDGSYTVKGQSARPLPEVLTSIGYVPPETVAPADSVSAESAAVAQPEMGAQDETEATELVGASAPADTTAESTDSFRWLLIGAGAVLLIGAGWFWFRQGRKSA